MAKLLVFFKFEDVVYKLTRSSSFGLSWRGFNPTAFEQYAVGKDYVVLTLTSLQWNKIRQNINIFRT